jgi:hypothetical protein
MGNTDRYNNRPVHRVDDHAMSESHWDSLNVYGREGHLRGCSHDEIQRLHFDPNLVLQVSFWKHTSGIVYANFVN